MTYGTVDHLWISNRGEVACDRHGGYYLAAAVERHPDFVKITTPLDDWIRTDTVGDPEGLACETCTAELTR